MSSVMKKIAKKMSNMRNNVLRFPASMYNNCYGSVAIVYCMCHGTPSTRVNALNKAWKKIMKDPDAYFDFTPVDTPDGEFVTKTLDVFRKLTGDPLIKVTDEIKKMICKVSSPYNVLFTVWDSRYSWVLPLREDGFEGITLKVGKVTYPVFAPVES